MQPVSNVDQVLLLLRKQLTERTQKGNKGAASSASARPQRGGGSERVADLLGQRISELRAAGMSDRAALTRVVLEQILLAEFGRDLANDAGFQRIVDDVQRALEDDPATLDLLSRLAP